MDGVSASLIESWSLKPLKWMRPILSTRLTTSEGQKQTPFLFNPLFIWCFLLFTANITNKYIGSLDTYPK